MINLIAFCLPQFHPIPENDEWWGRGFTEWTNVTRARPVIHGHYQPHLPADLGFYDLRLPEARAAQAQLASEYGVTGFCYYHYWFSGRRILSRPVDEIVASGRPNFPFCLCWANENWTRVWDGSSKQVLLEQRYSIEDDQSHIEHLLPILADHRYIRVGGKPIFLVYRTELLPNPHRTSDIWRTAALKAGIGEIFLARVESFSTDDPTTIGFDASVEFAPDWRLLHSRRYLHLRRILSKLGLLSKGYSENRLYNYNDLVNDMLAKPEPTYLRFRCVTPGWDNSARRDNNRTIILNSTPQAYGMWLKKILLTEHKASRPDNEKLVFVNAWNEWAEGNHLEPDQRWGRAYLEAHKDAVSALQQQINFK